jgi:hypothetical protein
MVLISVCSSRRMLVLKQEVSSGNAREGSHSKAGHGCHGVSV